jgi:hypothetical protein
MTSSATSTAQGDVIRIFNYVRCVRTAVEVRPAKVSKP